MYHYSKYFVVFETDNDERRANAVKALNEYTRCIQITKDSFIVADSDIWCPKVIKWKLSEILTEECRLLVILIEDDTRPAYILPKSVRAEWVLA